MNARDELAQIWADAYQQEKPVVDAILAAGYRKPRVVTTVEELDSLGRGATVLDPLGDVWTHDGDPEDQWGSITANEDFGGPQWYGSSNIELPVTVVYDPEAS